MIVYAVVDDAPDFPLGIFAADEHLELDAERFVEEVRGRSRACGRSRPAEYAEANG